jgi:FkbH-like protein
MGRRWFACHRESAKPIFFGQGKHFVKVTEALKIIQSAPANARPFSVVLACGFTPLHLHTFLSAHLQQSLPNHKVVVTSGLYGNLAETLEGASDSDIEGVAIALEWSDLDARLDFRSAGGWGRTAATDIITGAQAMLERLAGAISRVPSAVRIALSLPTLPLPPLFHTPGWQASEHELHLESELFWFAERVTQSSRVIVTSVQRLLEASPPGCRFDLKSHLHTGLPYTTPHADAVASQLALVLVPPAPKKGIISDLDDTLWSGIAGEIGQENVSWDIASHSQLHGLYQKLLASLSQHGTLVGIASKNDPKVVARAFEREDLLLRPEQVFPLEVHWKAKSSSVARILETWNIAADSVVFVDDSPMELAEVAAAHPGIECILFPKNDYVAGLAMLHRLRDLCGKEQVSSDDVLRLESIRQGATFRLQATADGTPESFLAQAEAVSTFDFGCAAEPRVLELVNKTNQFNLNGRRYTEADWRRLTSQPQAVVVSVRYEDKFGPLGTIAVAAGTIHGKRLAIETWVMSCRAFARRIEHQMLKMLFESTDAGEVDFDFVATAKNGPLQEFLVSLTGEQPAKAFRVSRAQFDQSCPPLYHAVRELRRAEAHG